MRGPNRAGFSCRSCRSTMPQGQRGGYGMIRLINAAFSYCPIFFVFLGLPPTIRLP